MNVKDIQVSKDRALSYFRSKILFVRLSSRNKKVPSSSNRTAEMRKLKGLSHLQVHFDLGYGKVREWEGGVLT